MTYINANQLSISTAHINKVLESALPEHFEHGTTWYTQANKTCREIATLFKLPVSLVVGCLSAISPNNKYNKNVMDTRNMCYAFVNRADTLDETFSNVKVSTYGANKRKAIAIFDAYLASMVAGRPMTFTKRTVRRILNGQKVTAFFDCIYDCKTNVSTVCVDGHAKNIYLGYGNTKDRPALGSASTNITKKQYKVISESYVRTAARYNKKHGANLLPYQVQAITWVAHRVSCGIKG
tara:strand:- start:61 stop:771 length:711 start_codon:yes stop_codon:yes gene_type:complete